MLYCLHSTSPICIVYFVLSAFWMCFFCYLRRLNGSFFDVPFGIMQLSRDNIFSLGTLTGRTWFYKLDFL